VESLDRKPPERAEELPPRLCCYERIPKPDEIPAGMTGDEYVEISIASHAANASTNESPQ